MCSEEEVKKFSSECTRVWLFLNKKKEILLTERKKKSSNEKQKRQSQIKFTLYVCVIC